MNINSIASSEVGSIFVEHQDSLPAYFASPTDVGHRWPSVLLFVVVPAFGAAAVHFIDVKPDAPVALLAGVSVLAGLLFSVLASVSGRIAALADGIGDRPPTKSEILLVRRLDIARANVAYATLVSVVFAVGLGVVGMLKKVPTWVTPVSVFVLLHLGITLVLVLVRINRIGKSDQVATLTAHARSRVAPENPAATALR